MAKTERPSSILKVRQVETSRVLTVVRVESVAKTERDEIPSPFGVQVDIGANIQHVIWKIAAGGSRLEPLTDARMPLSEKISFTFHL